MVNIKSRFKNPELRKKRLSEAHKGKVLSEETKRKISETLKKNPSFKGKKHTTESKEKNRLKHLGKTAWNKGLTKDTDERVAGYGKTNSKTRKQLIADKSDKIKIFGRGVNPFRAGKLNFWYGKDRSGELNPNWQGGISAEPYAPEWNEKLREKIRNKFDRICQLCTKSEPENEWGKLQVHHIDYNKKNCDEKNLIPLCVGCNFKVNYNRPKWINYFQTNFKEKLIL